MVLSFRDLHKEDAHIFLKSQQDQRMEITNDLPSFLAQRGIRTGRAPFPCIAARK
jgi:hypothetical protein